MRGSKTYSPFILNGDGSVHGIAATGTPDELERAQREYRRDNPQAFMDPLMKGPEVYELTGCASWGEMQQRGLQGVGFPQPAMQKLDYKNGPPPEAWRRYEVMNWFDKVLPVVVHYLRRQKKSR